MKRLMKTLLISREPRVVDKRGIQLLKKLVIVRNQEYFIVLNSTLVVERFIIRRECIVLKSVLSLRNIIISGSDYE